METIVSRVSGSTDVIGYFTYFIDIEIMHVRSLYGDAPIYAYNILYIICV